MPPVQWILPLLSPIVDRFAPVRRWLIGRHNAVRRHSPGTGIGDGAPATGAAIGFISSLAIDTAGNLFLTDLFEQRVRKIDANGIITTVGGDGIPGYSGDGGPATSASVYYPLASRWTPGAIFMFPISIRRSVS
jgi:hypothetical protein